MATFICALELHTDTVKGLLPPSLIGKVMFVEFTMTSSNADQNQVIRADLERKQELLGLVKDWFDELDDSKDGFIEETLDSSQFG